MISSAAFIINFPIRLFKCPSLTFAIAAAFFTVAIALIISELIVYPVILKFFCPYGLYTIISFKRYFFLTN